MFNFIIIPLIGLALIGLTVRFLPAILKMVGLRKYVDDNAISLINAALIASALLFFIFNLLRTVVPY